MPRMFLALALPFALAACGTSEPALRFAVPATETTGHTPVPYASIEVREVTLPTYAAQEDIHVETPSGGLSSEGSYLWADDPTRAVTLELARNLRELTGARVADEPWPFPGSAEARVEVRVEEMIAGRGGHFRLSGQYFTAIPDEDDAGHSAEFDLAEPYDRAAGPGAIAAARGRVVGDLAALIARDGF